MVVVVVFYVPTVQYYSMKRFFSEIIVPTDSFSFILIFKKIIASKMPRKRASEAVQQDTTRNQQGRSDKPAQDREECAQVNEQRRRQYAQESALQTPEEREQSNAHRRELRTELDAEERERVNDQRRNLYAQESAQQPAEERAQVNDGRRETYAERRARNLGKTRNNFIREPEASLDDIKLHSVGELCLTCRKCDARLFKGERTAAGNTFLSAAPRVRCKFRAYHDRHRHSMTT